MLQFNSDPCCRVPTGFLPSGQTIEGSSVQRDEVCVESKVATSPRWERFVKHKLHLLPLWETVHMQPVLRSHNCATRKRKRKWMDVLIKTPYMKRTSVCRAGGAGNCKLNIYSVFLCYLNGPISWVDPASTWRKLNVRKTMDCSLKRKSGSNIQKMLNFGYLTSGLKTNQIMLNNYFLMFEFYVVWTLILWHLADWGLVTVLIIFCCIHFHYLTRRQSIEEHKAISKAGKHTTTLRLLTTPTESYVTSRGIKWQKWENVEWEEEK